VNRGGFVVWIMRSRVNKTSGQSHGEKMQ